VKAVRIRLKALDYGLVEAWRVAFAEVAQVDASQGTILAERGDAIVSPANSFGYMDGGLDLIYSQHFGWDLEKRVRTRLLADYDGELPVGQAIVVPTLREDVPFLICAPTMRVPMNVSTTVNAYLAFRAALIAVREHNRTSDRRIESILCPGLGTGEGRMPHERCARQMRIAYDAIVDGQVETLGGLAGAVRNHMALVR
jgi:O-acetyl-ADP-ribose deacetylase (regulator of RNase III)